MENCELCVCVSIYLCVCVFVKSVCVYTFCAGIAIFLGSMVILSNIQEF